MKHKRISRAGISLLLVLCMVLSICPLTAFAKEDELNLVSLGASNVNGYGLRGYLKATGYVDDNAVMEDAALNSELKKNANVLGYNQAPAGSYPALLQEALSKQQGNTVNLSQLAISSMRAEELRILLDNNYNGDAYSAWRFIGEGNWFDIADGTSDGDFSQLREEYQTAVKKADLITVDIGANNFGVYLSQMLTNNFKSGNDLNLVDPQIGKLYNGAKAEVNALLAEYGISVEDYAELADTLVYALVGFCYNFDKSVERIYELNPDATVVVVSIQNLMAGLGAKLGDVEVPLGDIIGALINTANTYIAIGSPYSSKYLCADVRQNGRVEFFIDKMAAYNGNPANLDENIIDCFNVYDGNPKDSYDKGFHVKYQVAQMLITAGGDFSLIDTLDEAKVFLETDNGKALLNKVYDAYAQILSAGAKINTLDLATLDQLDNFKSIQSALEAAIGTAITTAATSTDPYTLPANFFSDIANSCDVSESVVKTVAAMAVRTDIGNSFFSHPTPDGHQKVADAILATLANKTTGEDIIKNEIEIAGEQLYRFAYDHGAESLIKVVDFVVGEGYITAEQAAMLKNQINLADPAIKSGDKQAILASCEKLAELVYAYADANGYIPAEVKEAYAKAIELYEKYGEMTPEEIKALAVAELKKFVAEHKAEALIALDTYLVNEGWMSTTEMKELAEKIAAAIAAYEADPEGTADKMIEELVNYIYNKAVAEGYIDPTKVEELNKLVDLIKEACDYFANTSEEQIKADAIALLFDELDKLTDGKVNAEVYAQIKQDVAKLIAALEDVTPETIQAKVDAYIDSIKAKYLALIDNATHGKYVPNSESYYVALGGDTVYGTGIGRDDKGYFDLLLAKLGLDGKTQYKNLGEKNLDLTKLLAYIEKNADEIEKADLITYQADATAFILAALNEEEPDWSRYLTEEQIAFVEQALPVIQTILEDDWTKYADLDVEQIVNDIETEVLAAIDAAIMDAFNDQADKLDELLNICVAQVKSYVEYIREQAVELNLEAVFGEAVDAALGINKISDAEKEFLEEALNFAFDYLVEDWGTYVDKSAAWISNQIKDAVIAEMYKHSSFGKEYIDQYADDLAAILTACIEEVQNVLQTAQNQKDEVLNVLNTIEPFKPYIENLLFASVAYAVDTAKAVDAIQAINPDATLIVVGMYNPLDGLEIVMNGKTIDVGAYMDYLIDATNVYYTALAVADGEFTFVAVPDTEINGFENAINVDELNVAQLGTMLLKLNDSMYADAAGHEYIFEQIMGALDTTNDVVSISVTSAPTKTSYIAGQNFDSTGMAITATYYDGSTAIVEGWSVTDGNNLPAGKTSVTISYTEGGVTKTTSQAITVAAKTLSSISVKTAPTKTSYIAGQNFDSTGMVIEKKYNDNSTATAIGWTVTDGNNLPAGKTSVTISYTEGGVTKTIKQAITVNSSNPGPGPGGGGGGAASYAVSAATATHGKVTVDKTSASAGDTVTITVVPEKGFTLETLTVKDAKGNEVALTAVKTGETYTFKMPAGKVTVSATFMEDNTMLNFFVDVPATEYYYDAVLWAAKNGITLGVDDTHFAPMAIATRGQMVTFLWRAAGCPEPTSTTCAFTDVKTSEYYYKAVLWAVETGITKGTSDTTFSPDAEVSRGQTVTFLARMSGVKDDETGYSHNFADVKTTDYYNNAVAWAATNKITEGTSATTFSPNDDCLRGQIVTFLYRNFVK